MRQTNIIKQAHNILLNIIHKDMIIVDATCGNGHDTLFLADKVKHIHAFDIQDIAIKHSKDLTKNYSNITFHQTSHEHLTSLIPHYDGIIFNLGYLPGADKSITTNHQTTLQTLKNIHNRHQGFVLIVAYPGHQEGFIEQVAVQSYLDKLMIHYEVIKLPRITKNEAPIIYFYTYTL